ncbi:hypothetical protein TNIN_219581 [Trichonephila inaurata madagascariensis]|uniref:Uncharacterized protein n=1 Tax=Trichonephila inaurata madagascariensis TaxID=2747483 RepID=A0A8X7CMI5_9ARAC|nr:hypothetical protein TNIN_219581 [Trichonephila inaurata madagascariensis]
MSLDYPVNRSRTKEDQSGPEEEELNRTDPTIRSQDANSSQQARVARRPREDGQEVRIPEAEEPDKNNEEDRTVEDHSHWRS